MKRTAFSYVKAHASSYLFLFPFMAFFLVFTVVPVLTAILLSFTDFNTISVPGFVGLENYERMLLDDPVFLISLKNTLLFAVVTGPVSYILCVLLAWLVNEMPHSVKVLLTVVFYAPSLTINATLIWTLIFSGDAYGFANSALLKLGLIRDPVLWLTDPQYNMGVIILVQLWLSLGTGFLSFIAGFQAIDRSIYEAGANDGIRNRFHEFWYLTLPSIRPQLMFGAVMQIAASFSISSVPIALTGFPSTNYSTSTIVTHILDSGATKMEMGYASAMAVTLFAGMILVRNVVSMIIKSED